MAIPLAAMAIGAGISGISGYFGNRAKKKAANKAAAEQRKRTSSNDALIAQLMGQGAGRGEDALFDYAGNMKSRARSSFKPREVDFEGYDADQVDTSGFDADQYGIDPNQLGQFGNYDQEGNTADLDDLGFNDFDIEGLDYNGGNDGINQFLRGGGGGYSGTGFSGNATALSNLENIAGGNTQFDTTALSSRIKTEEDRDLNDQIVQLRGGAGSLGARHGSALTDIEGQTRVRGQEKMNARREAAAMSAFEAAQMRRLAATGQLGDMDKTRANVGVAEMEGRLKGAGNNLTALQMLSNNTQANNATRIAAGNTRLSAKEALMRGRLSNADMLNTVGAGNKGRALTADQSKNANLLSMLTTNAGNKLGGKKLLADLLSGNSNAKNDSRRFNSQGKFRAGSTNAENDIRGEQVRNQADQFSDAQISQILAQIMGSEGQRRGQNASLLGLRERNAPGPNQYAGGGWDVLGDIGSAIPLAYSMRGAPSGAAGNAVPRGGTPPAGNIYNGPATTGRAAGGNYYQGFDPDYYSGRGRTG